MGKLEAREVAELLPLVADGPGADSGEGVVVGVDPPGAAPLGAGVGACSVVEEPVTVIASF